MLLNPNPGLVIWTIVTFICLLLVLRKLAWKPLLDSLHKREETVRTSIERAEQAQQEAERMLDEHRKRLELAEQEGRRILEEHRTLASKLKDEMLQHAQNQSQQMIDKAKQEIERDKEAALTELKEDVADLAIQAAGKILDETLDEKRHRKVIDSYLQARLKN